MELKEISISLSVVEWNVVLQALGGRPFTEVAEIIAKMKEQGSKQIESEVVPEQVREAA